MLGLVADFQQQKPLALNPSFVDGIRSILCNTTLDKVFYFRCKAPYVEFFCNAFLKAFDLSVQEFISKALTLPGEGEIMDMMPVADPDAVHAVRTFIRKELALQLKQELLSAVSFFFFLCASYVSSI